MSIDSLLNQTITHYAHSSYGKNGRESFSTGSSIRARLQPKTKRILGPDGTVLTINAIAFISKNNTVNTNDKITYGTTVYKVADVYPVPDDMGETDHIELRLILWP